MPRRLSIVDEHLGLLDADRADQDRPAGLLHLRDLVDDRVELRVLVAEDEVRVSSRIIGRWVGIATTSRL